jgi:hypothetical protein
MKKLLMISALALGFFGLSNEATAGNILDRVAQGAADRAAAAKKAAAAAALSEQQAAPNRVSTNSLVGKIPPQN